MKLAIIGTGNIAQGLATIFSGTERSVTLGGRNAAKAKEAASVLSDTLGRSIAGDSVAAAVPGADTVFLAVPYEAVPAVLTAADDWSADLATAAGFEAVDAGLLSNARNLQPLAAFNIYLGYGQGLGTQRAPVFIERPTR